MDALPIDQHITFDAVRDAGFCYEDHDARGRIRFRTPDGRLLRARDVRGLKAKGVLRAEADGLFGTSQTLRPAVSP